MKDFLISVVIPVYNVEKYLQECLDSVSAQTYENFEAVIIDDGSQDTSGAICDSYAARDTRLRVIHQKNSGLSAARNAGLDASRGAYLLFLDSDDMLRSDALEKLAETVSGGEDFVIFDAECFSDSDRNSPVMQGYIRTKQYPSGKGIEMFDALQSSRDYKFSACLSLYRTAFLAENRLRFYEGILYEDVIFSFETYCKADRVSHLYEPLYRRRIREASIMTAAVGSKNYLSAEKVLCAVIRLAQENGVINKASVQRYLARIAMRAPDIYSRLSVKDKRDLRGNYQKTIRTIRGFKGFNNTALLCRTYGKIPWAIRRAYEKIRGD